MATFPPKSGNFREMCEKARNLSSGQDTNECQLLAEMVENVSDLMVGPSTSNGPFNSTMSTKDFTEKINWETSSGDLHKINTTKLVVLTIIILFTVVGNFGVVLAILLRR